jgi:hypothetical protein
MIKTKNSTEPSRLPVAKNAANSPGPKGGNPSASGTPNPNPAPAAALATDPSRTASKASPASLPSGPSGPVASKTQSKPKAGGPSDSGKAGERRDAHVGHATVAPTGRERGSGGGFGGSQRHGQPDIQDWMPFSAQQSRILRMPRTHPAVGLTKVIAHPVHPFTAVIFSIASQFYSEVLPSFFRRTPREIERNNREIHKDALRKEQKRKSEANEARREAIRKRAAAGSRRVLAGDLTAAFAAK